jgi:hypothetical protein
MKIHSRADAQPITAELGGHCDVAWYAVFLENTAAHEGAIEKDSGVVHGIELNSGESDDHSKLPKRQRTTFRA